MRPFKTSDQKYIRDHYGVISVADIAKHLGRHKSVVQGHIKRMGLKLPDDVRAARQAIGTFKPGQLPHNAGTKGKMKPNSTSFKPGQLPHNTKHDDAITIRADGGKQYQFTRVSKGKWIPLHRQNWEQAYGPVPAGHIITFIDGNTMNAELENLKCISRAENVARNMNREKQAESMKHKWKVKKTMAKMKKDFPALFN
jgi:hypothetical protein